MTSGFKLRDSDAALLIEMAKDILRDDRHWSVIDVSDRAENGVGLATALLEALSLQEDACADDCNDCSEHAERIGD